MAADRCLARILGISQDSRPHFTALVLAVYRFGSFSNFPSVELFSIVMLCSWTVDGVQTTAASNVLQLWQVALYNIRILRPTLLGLDRNIPMYSSWTCASSLVEFVTWLYWIWFLGFCKSNTGDFWRNEWLHCENSRKNRPRNALLRSAIWPHRLSLWDDQVLLDPQLAFGPVSSVECLCNALWHWIPFNTLIGWPIHCAFIHGWVIH